MCGLLLWQSGDVALSFVKGWDVRFKLYLTKTYDVHFYNYQEMCAYLFADEDSQYEEYSLKDETGRSNVSFISVEMYSLCTHSCLQN